MEGSQDGEATGTKTAHFGMNNKVSSNVNRPALLSLSHLNRGASTEVGQPPLIGPERLLKDWVKAMITEMGDGGVERKRHTACRDTTQSMTYCNSLGRIAGAVRSRQVRKKRLDYYWTGLERIWTSRGQAKTKVLESKTYLSKVGELWLTS